MTYDLSIEIDQRFTADVDRASLTLMIERVLDDAGVEERTGLSLVVADDELLHSLNLAHRGVDAATDVLSFGAEEGEAFPVHEAEAGEAVEPRYLGDIALSVETARRQAAEAGLAPDEEIGHLVLHGVLHLLGYDHETPEEEAEMRAREEAVLGPRIHAAGGDHTHD